MSNKQKTISRILLIIAFIIGIGIGVKISFVSAKELTPADHDNARMHAHAAFEHLEQAVLRRAVLHREHLKTHRAHDAKALHFDVDHSLDVNAA
ncbi:MAG TPA: hypothetical protein VJT15_13430 [Pyrinomonadaceae bacterium]|nr:hypothetical protein [Pyrinomonadaceae bacterium]